MPSVVPIRFNYTLNNQKPPVGSEIDWSNPLTRGLVIELPFNEEGGRDKVSRNLVTSKGTTAYGLEPTWVDSRWGRARYFDGTQFLDVLGSDDKVNSTGPMSVIVHYDHMDWWTNNSSAFCGRRTRWTFKASQYPQLGRLGFTKNGITDHVSSYQMTTHGACGISFDNGALILALNGATEGTTISTDFAAQYETNWFTVGQGATASDKLIGAIAHLAVWNRALSADELRELMANPWQLLKPYVKRVYAFIGAGSQPGFNAAWARAANQFLGRGLR